MSASSGNVTQVMTRYLHLITNSRSSWNSLVCVDYQAKQELFKHVKCILFWPIPFVLSKVLFTDSSLRCVEVLFKIRLKFVTKIGPRKVFTCRELVAINLACSRLSVVGDERKRARKNEGGLRRGAAGEPVTISLTTLFWYSRSCSTL